MKADMAHLDETRGRGRSDRHPTAPGLLLVAWVLLAGLAALAALAGCASAPPAQREAAVAMVEQDQGGAPAEQEAGEAKASEMNGAEAVAAAAAAMLPDPDAYEKSLGIRITGLRLTAGDFMLDFRFRVLDAAKAAPLFDRGTKPYLVDEASGAQFMVPTPPKTGPLRTSDPPQEGRVYWTFFANPGRYLEGGDRVSIVYGDYTFEHLLVE